MAVVVEITPNAAEPVLDHCDQFDGIFPRGVELKVSINQGDADGAVRDSNCSKQGMMREADFLFMTSLVLGRPRDLRNLGSTEFQTGIGKVGGIYSAGTGTTRPMFAKMT